MNDKQVFFLVNPNVKANAIEAIRGAPDTFVCEIKPRTRSLDQNAKLHAMITEISRQVKWNVEGELQLISMEDWKAIFTAGLKNSQRMARGIDGGVVMLGSRTSKMSIKMMNELIELIYAFGAERGVVFKERYDG